MTEASGEEKKIKFYAPEIFKGDKKKNFLILGHTSFFKKEKLFSTTSDKKRPNLLFHSLRNLFFSSK